MSAGDASNKQETEVSTSSSFDYRDTAAIVLTAEEIVIFEASKEYAVILYESSQLPKARISLARVKIQSFKKMLNRFCVTGGWRSSGMLNKNSSP